MFLSREGAVLESPELAVSFISENSATYSGEDERRVEYVVSTLDLGHQDTSTQPASAQSVQASDYGEDSRCAVNLLSLQNKLY